MQKGFSRVEQDLLKNIAYGHLALIRSAVECRAPAWCRSKHTHLVDNPKHDALQLVTGCFRPNLIDNIFVLASITPRRFTKNELHCVYPAVQWTCTTARTQIKAPSDTWCVGIAKQPR